MPSIFTNKNKKKAKKIIEQNGFKDFSVKEVMVMLHQQNTESIQRVEIKVDKETDRRNNKVAEIYKQFTKCQRHHDKLMADHDSLFQKIMIALPEKGFCEKVNNSLFPEKEMSLSQKVQTMWFGYKMMKYAAITSTTAIIIGVVAWVSSIFG